ncbi:hypothetical protein CBS101457_001329 [Exobasidium rhododendri]|nr:hypothetical protein CBS101457_001329 [Exobasidium rhododendri]
MVKTLSFLLPLAALAVSDVAATFGLLSGACLATLNAAEGICGLVAPLGSVGGGASIGVSVDPSAYGSAGVDSSIGSSGYVGGHHIIAGPGWRTGGQSSDDEDDEYSSGSGGSDGSSDGGEQGQSDDTYDDDSSSGGNGGGGDDDDDDNNSSSSTTGSSGQGGSGSGSGKKSSTSSSTTKGSSGSSSYSKTTTTTTTTYMTQTDITKSFLQNINLEVGGKKICHGKNFQMASDGSHSCKCDDGYTLALPTHSYGSDGQLTLDDFTKKDFAFELSKNGKTTKIPCGSPKKTKMRAGTQLTYKKNFEC